MAVDEEGQEFGHGGQFPVARYKLQNYLILLNFKTKFIARFRKLPLNVGRIVVRVTIEALNYALYQVDSFLACEDDDKR